MINRALKIILFISFLNIPGAHSQTMTEYGQPPPIIENYNRWLDSVQLLKIIYLDSVVVEKSMNTIGTGSAAGTATLFPRIHKTGKIGHDKTRYILLIFRYTYNSNYENPSLAWDSVKYGFMKRRINVEEVLKLQFSKLVSFAEGETHVSLTIRDDHIATRGVNDTKIPFNFDMLINSLLTRSFPVNHPISNLSQYCKPLLMLFRRYNHPDKDSVRVKFEMKPDLLDCTLTHLYGQVTQKKFYELIEFSISLVKYEKNTEVYFEIKQLKYAGGMRGAPKTERAYADIEAEPDFTDQRAAFSDKLEEDLIRTIK